MGAMATGLAMGASNVIIDIIAHDKASSVANSVSSAFGKLATTLTAIAAAGAAAFVVLGKEAIEATAEYERLTISLESLVARQLLTADSTLTMADALAQAAPQAKELLKWTQELAINSPFDQEGISKAFQMALNYGFTSDEAVKLTENLVDLTAATGRGTFEMNNIARALGQVKSRGKLTAEEINQLTEAGVGVNSILKSMGYTLEDVSKGLVSADEFLLAFNDTMEREVGGSAERLTQSWAGLISTFTDLKKLGLRTLFADTLAVLQPLVAKFSEWLQGDGLKVLEGWGEQMGNITQNIVDMFSALSSGDFNLSGMMDSIAEWAKNIDWDKISNDIADGISSIDWTLVGATVSDGINIIIQTIYDIIGETDWAALFESITKAFGQFFIGLFFQTEEGLDSIKQGIKDKLDEWKEDVDKKLIAVKEVFRAQFSQMIQVALNALIRGVPLLVAIVTMLMSALKSAIKPLVISIALPNPAVLLRQVQQILNILSMLSGAGGQSLGAQVGGGSNKPKPQIGATPHAAGGLARSGNPYLVGEQGAELFVPDENGYVVSNKKMGGGGSNMVINLTYAPAFSTASKDELLSNIRPMLDDWYRLRLQS